MDNETKKMFEILMKKLDTIEENQNGMNKNQKSMIERQKNMEIRQNEIFSIVKSIELSNITHKAEP